MTTPRSPYQTRISTVFGLMAVFGFGACGREPRADQPVELSGYGATAHVSDRLVLQEAAPTVEEVTQVISTVAPSRSQVVLSNVDLANIIAVTSSCLDLETRVLASLIRKESAFFEAAVSPTGAMGLTQFTEIAVKEVRDQLGFGSAGSARAATVTYFRDKTQNCVGPQLGIFQWSDPWSDAADISPGAVKVALVDNPTLSVVYGAVLLKTYLAVELHLSGGSTREVYRRGLMRYNGDPAVREAYASKILQWVDSW